MVQIKSVLREFEETFQRLFRRDFSGNEGSAIKNSTWNLMTTVWGKAISFIFTIVIARILLPELFGLYSLALSTILFFNLFSELGISTAMLTFVSKSLGNNDPKKARAYYDYLLKYKFGLIVLSSSLLLISANFIANNFYNKPIFYALLAGAIYIPAISLQSYLASAFHSENNYKFTFFKESLFQILRIIFVPLAILYSFKFPTPWIILSIILATAFVHILVLLFLAVSTKKSVGFLKQKSKENLTSEEKTNVRKFIIPLSLIVFSGLFFGYIDTIMLGHYVEGTYLGYYGAAFGLIGAAAAIIGFLPGALLPIFSRIKGKSLKRAFRKTRNWLILISISAVIFTIFTAEYILIIYGAEYLPATKILRMLSLLLILLPLANLYDTYLISRERTKIIAILLISSTILNVFLNWFFITEGLKISMMQAVVGAATATMISRAIYLVGIMFAKKRVSGNF